MRTAHMPESLTEWRDIGFRNPQTPAAIRYTDNIDQRVYGSNFVEMNLPHRNPVRFRFRVCNDTKDTECHLLHLICSFHLLQNWTNLLHRAMLMRMSFRLMIVVMMFMLFGIVILILMFFIQIHMKI